jgi:quercetin dioxygenase-like cupin family protein
MLARMQAPGPPPQENAMRHRLAAAATAAALLLAGPALPQDFARPEPLLREVVTGMPRGERQEIFLATAEFRPGQATPFHTHRFPVTVHVLEGAFTLEMQGRAPVVVRAGQSMVEPPGVPMIGRNASASERLRVMIFYVGDPDTPFLDTAR